MLQRGCVVLSSHGRDKGLYLAVLDYFDHRVHLADGRERKVENPKRKNPRHVQETDYSVGEASMATNRELRRALAAVTADRATVT